MLRDLRSVNLLPSYFYDAAPTSGIAIKHLYVYVSRWLAIPVGIAYC